MRNHRIVRSLTIAVALAGVVVAAQDAASDCRAGDCVGAESGGRGAGVHCRRPLAGICSRCGEKVCVTYASPAKETRQCWEVECAEVCIPPVRFPWHCRRLAECGECLSTPLPGCGKVRRVRKLKAVEYECDTCEYEHRIVCRCPNCGPLPHSQCLPLSAARSRQPAACDGDHLAREPESTGQQQWSARLLPELFRRSPGVADDGKPGAAADPVTDPPAGGLSGRTGHSVVNFEDTP